MVVVGSLVERGMEATWEVGVGTLGVSWAPDPGAEAVVPRTGTEADPDPDPAPEVAEVSEPDAWGVGTVPMGLVGVGIKAVLLPPNPIVGKVGMRPVDLGAVGMRPVLPVAVVLRPRSDSKPDPMPPRRSPVGVGVAEVVAEAGTLTGIVD